MDESDIEIAKRGYAVWNEVYRTGDVELVRPFLEEHWAADAVFVPAGILPESQPVHGVDGLMRFTLEQMKAFADGSMWIEPLEFIDRGDALVVRYRFGGTANHTGLPVEWEFAHVFTQRHGKTVRCDVYPSLAEALADVGAAD